MKKTFLAITLFGVCTAANAIDGNMLYEWLTSTSPGFVLAANAYIRGVVDHDDLMRIVDEGIPHRGHIDHICPPINATGRQFDDIVQIYLRDNPAERQWKAVQSVQIAMTKAFPCKK